MRWIPNSNVLKQQWPWRNLCSFGKITWSTKHQLFGWYLDGIQKFLIETWKHKNFVYVSSWRNEFETFSNGQWSVAPRTVKELEQALSLMRKVTSMLVGILGRVLEKMMRKDMFTDLKIGRTFQKMCNGEYLGISNKPQSAKIEPFNLYLTCRCDTYMV